MPVEQADGGEHHAAQDRQRDQVQQRLGDDRPQHHRQRLAGPTQAPGHDQRARGLTQARRQGGRHQHPDERSLRGVAPLDLHARKGGAQDLVPGHGAQRHRGAHQAQAHQDPRRAGRQQRLADVPQPDPLQRQHAQHQPEDRGQSQACPSQQGQHRAARASSGGGRLRRGQPPGADPRTAVRRGHAYPDGGSLRPRTRNRGRLARLRVDLEHLVGHAGPAEAPGALAGGRRHRRPPLRLQPEVAQRLGQLGGIAPGDQQPVHPVADHVAVAGDVRGHDRRAGGERLGEHHPEALASQRGGAEHVRLGQRPLLALVGDLPQHGDVAGV